MRGQRGGWGDDPRGEEKTCAGTSLAVQWLRLRASTARDEGSIPGQGTKIPHAWGAAKKQTNRKRPELWQGPWGQRGE